MSNEATPLTEAEINAREASALHVLAHPATFQPNIVELARERAEFVATIRSLQSAAVAREWVPVTDRLPVEADFFDITVHFVQDGHHSDAANVGLYCPPELGGPRWVGVKGDPIRRDEMDLTVTVTAWRPRPLPYSPVGVGGQEKAT